MTGLYKTRTCSECPHLVISGIACDWQPHECPIQMEKKQRQQASRTKAFFLTNLLIADDFDAVRSSN
ncbi:MAG: hypothetical protein LC541_00080 [Candidatus Thiodiazotropha sp.]|nr:hypothetical protein [Candidatus Thiodiazotropha sp.]MCU7805197.1 hypothetical protein [Candidatus Thiodiazotropha sp. (ex Lucinoma borealis)]MCU7838846.1 hypothetical protein [Candidatus Thiodiazotropha sp. (ex Troendleina suluensis)]MCU7886186.1 hypothetical protein [Candidatus Thiodiazotropha sp. (ex Lucinoma annulata)]MCU7929495.1 hypothetical protein [Candidatus Thiodiazotropha sp. (ex Codakia rugifera)]MCU7945476.1 hypothetical protein [Candidatus Thiodiazotropha sp. (ex Cardiolucina 